MYQTYLWPNRTVLSASRSSFEEMDLLAGCAMPVTLVLRTPLSCPADSPNITVLARVLSYSGSLLTEYEVTPPFDIESSANFPLAKRDRTVTTNSIVLSATERSYFIFLLSYRDIFACQSFCCPFRAKRFFPSKKFPFLRDGRDRSEFTTLTTESAIDFSLSPHRPQESLKNLPPTPTKASAIPSLRIFAPRHRRPLLVNFQPDRAELARKLAPFPDAVFIKKIRRVFAFVLP